MNVNFTDEEMIRQFLPNQPNHCFETLYNRYVHKIYRKCLSMTQDSEKAQDFTQDIFLKAFNKLEAFQQRSSFSTWLYSIAYNYCADQLRLAKRLQTTTLDADLDLAQADTDESQLHEDSLYLMKLAMESLSPDERKLLRLKYEDNMSIEEIAQCYNLKTSAVKMRLKRSREKIQKLCVSQSYYQ